MWRIKNLEPWNLNHTATLLKTDHILILDSTQIHRMLYKFLTEIQGESAQNVMVRAHISVPQICMYRISAGFSKPLWSHQFSHNHTGVSESAIKQKQIMTLKYRR